MGSDRALGESARRDLVLGPLLRHLGGHDATLWVETDGPCEVEILGRRQRTFHVAGHHYAIVVLEDLEPGETYAYEVRLDGERAWPERSSRFPPSLIRTLEAEGSTKILFGSCRVSFPNEPPYTLSPSEHPSGRGHDALRAYARRMLDAAPDEWPAAIVLLGDQVYADEVSPETVRFIRSRRDTSVPPHDEVAEFEEYTRLYQEAWSEPLLRWLLSTVATAMLFADHDVHDDWNISHAWVERMRSQSWWDERIVGAFSSYWLYQHLGNLSPSELAEDELLAQVEATDDAEPILREFARAADRQSQGARWSFHRDFGGTRLIAVDCRAGRVLEEGRRSMLDDHEWAWLADRAAGNFDHVLLAMSDPYVVAAGIHWLQAWNEKVCEGVWGKAFARLGERLRERGDLDHWSSFSTAFTRLTTLVRQVGSGEQGHEPPASIVALSGDVHNAYLAEIAFPLGARVKSRVYQAVCSPLRNPLSTAERLAQRFVASRAASAVGRTLARLAGVQRPTIRWRYVEGPYFENHVATITLRGRSASMRLERAVGDGNGQGVLVPVFERRLV